MELVLTPHVEKQLLSIVDSPGGSYLFVGHEALGKYSSAHRLARRLCSEEADITLVQAEKSSIGIADIHKLRQSLNLKGRNMGQNRVVIIRDGDKMTREAQNALLKTLEEPPLDTTMIITTKHLDSLLPTVVSRCRKIEFQPPSAETMMRFLGQLTNSQESMDRILKLSYGRPAVAVRLLKDEDFRRKTVTQYRLAAKLLESDTYEKLLAAQDISGAKELSEVMLKMARILRAKAREKPDEAAVLAPMLKLVERLARYLSANGSPKLALDKLILGIRP